MQKIKKKDERGREEKSGRGRICTEVKYLSVPLSLLSLVNELSLSVNEGKRE